MRNSCVAVLDIRSTEVCAAACESGVNGTFNIKSEYRCEYDGYVDGALLDEESFCSAVREVLSGMISSLGRRVKQLYVSIPGEFVRIHSEERSIAFSARKKIKSSEVMALYQKIELPQDSKFAVIHDASEYYVLSDKRKVIDPVGCYSDSLTGVIHFYLADKTFMDSLSKALSSFEYIKDVVPVPGCFAQAMYLLSEANRDEGCVLIDLGEISSTYSYVHGNAVCFTESFSVGVGHLALHLSDELELPYPFARKLLNLTNLSCRESSTRILDITHEGKRYSLATSLLRSKIREGLDGLCETLDACRQADGAHSVEGKSFFVTGEAANVIKGGLDHISSRMVTSLELLTPTMPCYDKPQYSSLFSLIHIALTDGQL